MRQHQKIALFCCLSALLALWPGSSPAAAQKGDHSQVIRRDFATGQKVVNVLQ